MTFSPMSSPSLPVHPCRGPAAARRTLPRGALTSVEATLDRARSLLPADDPTSLDVEECLSQVLSLAGKRDRAVAVGGALLARLRDDQGAARRRAEVYLRLARAALPPNQQISYAAGRACPRHLTGCSEGAGVDLDLRRTMIVTGGSAGIGAATVRQLVYEGAAVVACARGEEELQATLRAVDGAGNRTLGVALDLMEADAPAVLHAAALERFGRIDGIVNNVGTSLRGPFDETTDECWSADLELKLFSALRLVRACLPDLRQRGSGSIVNVLSIGAKQPGASSMPTSVTRAAGLAFTKALSKELGPDGIRVNAVCVGLIRSRQHDRRWQESAPELSRDEWYRQLLEPRRVPLGRAGEPGEVASMIALLLSDLSGFTSGTAVNIDGGQAAVV